MAAELKLTIGQHTDKGRKPINQDFHGALIPAPPALATKGISIALADGISTSEVSNVAAETAIKGFLTDYYCTSDAWPVKTSARRVIAATNSWLHAQTRRGRYRYDMDKGYVCTLTVMVVKSATAHLFHVGDCRAYRVTGKSLEQLTEDHRLVVSPQETYLGRALGINPDIEIDYRAIPIRKGDVFILATDGVYEHVPAAVIVDALRRAASDLDQAARSIVQKAIDLGSDDNLTIQIVRVDEIPDIEAADVVDRIADVPLPPLPEPRAIFDGYRILRVIHSSSRSHIYLASDLDSGNVVALKLPSVDLREDMSYLKRFMMEEWVARRIDNAHVVKAVPLTRPRSFLYVAMEFVEGQTLSQWMRDNPRPQLEVMRTIVEQIASGLRAFHRMEMLHQDLRPDNILIDRFGTVKIIDFGSTKVAGVLEARQQEDLHEILGTAQYTAPEYFSGEPGSPRSDLFSLGVIAFQMLTGHLPYGAKVSQAHTKSKQRKLTYVSSRAYDPAIPIWIDRTLKRAVEVNPAKRYESLSELVFDLRHPKEEYLRSGQTPLNERNPLLIWKALSMILACAIVWLLFTK